MLEYRDIVIKALPMMLSKETKGKAAITIASYMNGMLRKVQNETELRIFAETLQSCKMFAEENGLNGLLRTCMEWNHEGILKLNSFREAKQQNITQFENNRQLAFEIVEELKQIQKVLSQNSTVDTDELGAVKSQLDQIDDILLVQGNQIFQPQELEIVKKTIEQQRESLRIKLSVINETFDINHM